MERDEFLSKLGIGALTICVGSCLAACGKSGGDPAPTDNPPITNNPPPGNPLPVNPPPSNPPPSNPPPSNSPPTNPPPANALYTADLNSALKNIGDSGVSNGVIVARIAAGNAASSFIAVQVACTHEGGTLAYNSNQGLFICPLHGSIFSKTGSVVQGPAATALKQYNISVTDSTLSVTA
ncbi:QcrA and Rieske domain-containing protein [Mucilaginibacter antarcticus]|uniref:Ubiquinol-cytochrome c reductase iron-sulfur subunit n=1 Tax=Mucilaginibacter antarcticus TaxID=1855725 RepID=A0ABW5XSJ8_9SPHI